MEGLSQEYSEKLHISRLPEHARIYFEANRSLVGRVADRIYVISSEYLAVDPQLSADKQLSESALHVRLGTCAYGRAVADAIYPGKDERRDQIRLLLLWGCPADWLAELDGNPLSAYLLSRQDAIVNVDPETLSRRPGMLDMQTGARRTV